MVKSLSRLTFVAAAFLAIALPAVAQSEDSRWGFSTSIVPKWSIPPESIGVLFGDDLVVEGGEMRIGVARGRMLSGDWSINYVRKKIADGSFIAIDGGVRVADRVVIDGVAIDKFIPFGTIKRRAQIGLTVGGGAGWAKGEVTERDSRGRTVSLTASTLLEPLEQKLAFVPLARVELGVAMITFPGLKVRASAGFNYPGITRFTLGSVYLFGGR